MTKRKTENDWWKNNFFDAGMSKILFGTEKIRPSRDDVAWIIKVADIKPRAKILDIGCGVGRHSVAFAKNGFDVTGLDVSRNFLKQAALLARQEKASLKLKCLPMHLISYKKEFDLVTSLFTSFGYYSPRSWNLSIFKRMVKALKPGGTIVLDATYREAIERYFQPRNWRILGNRSFVLEKRLYSRKRKQIYNDWLLVDGKKKKHYKFKLHLFSIKEFKKLFQKNGLKIIGCYGSLLGAPFKRDCPHIVIVAKK